MTLLLMIAGLFALILIDVPIAVALGVVAVIAMALTQGTDILPNVALVMYDGATKFPLLAIPMFVLAGAAALAGDCQPGLRPSTLHRGGAATTLSAALAAPASRRERPAATQPCRPTPAGWSRRSSSVMFWAPPSAAICRWA